ncbi:MAG: NAD(P)H-hydrate epimerase [Saccharofermentans sp.]|nr:NAD(P)H-hydrate epimerase [Saccharofermentans sp.]
MSDIITGTKAKEIDRYAIDVLNIPSLTLMENASTKVADFCYSQYKLNNKIIVLSGVGNNGADGICIAQLLLQNNSNIDIEVIINGNLEKASWEFLYQLSKLKEIGGKISYYKGENLPDGNILVDALFGIGLLKPLRPDALELVAKADEKNYQNVIAVDVPSGINSDTGDIMGAAIHANTTITFGRNKTGLVNKDGPVYSGTIIVEDIGIPDELYEI